MGLIIILNAKISLILPTYNRPEFFRKALESALAQDYDNFEIIVVNDGGKSVAEIIKNYNSEKIKYIDSEINKGLPAARNIGIKNSIGEYICFLDDDDIIYKNHLSVFITNMPNEKNCAGVYSDAKQTFINQKNEILYSKVQHSINWQKELFAYTNYIHVLTYLIKREVLNELNYFDEKFRYALEDYDLLIRLSENYYLKHIPIVTCEYIRHQGSSFLNENFDLNFVRRYIKEKNKVFFDMYEKDIEKIRINYFETMFQAKYNIFKDEINVKKIILYGTGAGAKLVTAFLKKINKEINFYIKTKIEKIEELFYGKKVISRNDFINYYASSENYFVIICISDLKALFEIMNFFKGVKYSDYILGI